MREERVALRQRRDLSQIIEAALSMYLQNAPPLFLIAAVVVPLGIASAVFDASIEDELAAEVVADAFLVADLFVTTIVVGAIIAGLRDIDAGRAIGFAQAYDTAFERLGALVGATVRMMFHVVLLAATLIGIPWAIQRLVRWLFIVQAVMIEGANWKSALSASAAVVVGSWWRTLGMYVVIWIMAVIPAGIVGSIFLLAPPLASGTALAILHALVLPFFTTATTLLYFDLKVRKEGVASVP